MFIKDKFGMEDVWKMALFMWEGKAHTLLSFYPVIVNAFAGALKCFMLLEEDRSNNIYF